jgi:hypothetical protein
VGNSVTFNLKVNPDPSKPVFTVGATLKYDPTILSFQDATIDKAWMPLSRSPYEVTDTGKGIITRTAGYPEGLKSTANFTNYTFKATTPGETKVVISEGMSLDAENNDSGIQTKTITIRVGGKKEAPITTTEVVPAKKNVQQTIVLDLLGSTALYSSEDYNFSVEHALKVEQPTMGTTTVSVYDQNGAETFASSQPFNISTSTPLTFSIPGNTLQPGDYSMVVTTKHSDQKTPTTLTKELGVLTKADRLVEKEVPVEFIPLYVYVAFGILLLVIFFMILHRRSKKFRNFIKNF